MLSKAYIFFIVFTLGSSSLVSQETDIKLPVTALAEIQNVKATGKRHNSFFFTFRIIEILEGTAKDSFIHSQEIYHDFGGKQMLSKIYPEAQYLIQKEKDKPQNVIVKFVYASEVSESKVNCKIIWLAEKYRQKSLEHLEKLLQTYSFAENPGNNLLLKEYQGRLFFGDGSKAKVVIESSNGSWHMATIDKSE